MNEMHESAHRLGFGLVVRDAGALQDGACRTLVPHPHAEDGMVTRKLRNLCECLIHVALRAVVAAGVTDPAVLAAMRRCASQSRPMTMISSRRKPGSRALQIKLTQMFSRGRPSLRSRLKQASAAAPAPEVTSLTCLMSLPTTYRPLSRAAPTTMAVPC